MLREFFYDPAAGPNISFQHKRANLTPMVQAVIYEFDRMMFQWRHIRAIGRSSAWFYWTTFLYQNSSVHIQQDGNIEHDEVTT